MLLEDLESAYQQLHLGSSVTLPAKSTSFQSWARRLQAHARSASLSSEASLWLDEARQNVAPLPTDASGPNTPSSERSVSISLDPEETKLLLQEVPTAWRAHINDVLLTALARALCEWTGQSQALVNLEGHGREDLFDDVDLSRTVGWFTSFTPVLLPVPEGGSSGESLRAVRDSLRRLPHHGIGFGLLEWLGPPDLAQRLQALPVPQVAFNYLGQFDAAAASSRLFSLASEPSGPVLSPSGERLHVLEVNGSVFQGRLQLAFGYSAHLHHAATIERLSQRFLHHLRALISSRASEDARRFSPGDFPLASLSQPALDSLLRQAGPDVEDLYPLTPTQQGILFHALLSSSAYFEQDSWTITSALDLPAFLRAWSVCLQRHTILRSSFHWEGLEAPLQVVHSQVELPFELLDWSHLPAAEQRTRFEQLIRQDKQRGLDLRRAPLVRLTAIRLAEESLRFIWSHHHLLVDGWSLGLLMKEVFSLYESFRSGVAPPSVPGVPFHDYIAWLSRREASGDEAYWRSYLEGLTAPTPLPADTHAAATQGQSPTYPTLVLEFSPEDTARLQSFARQQQLTLHTLALASWGLVLSRYCGEQDVVFGNTVAGRPPELPGSDSMVGVFINSLPVRVRLPSASVPVMDWLQSLQAQQLEQRQYEHSPLVQVQAFSQVPRGLPLFESLLVFENFPLDASLLGSSSSFQVSDVQGFEHTNYPLNLSFLPGKSLRLRLVYEEPRFESASMQRMLEHLRTALLTLTSSAHVGDLSLLTEAERQQVLVEWNDTAADVPADASATPSSRPRPGAPRTLSPSSSARTPSPTASSTSAPTNSPTTCSPWASAPRCVSPCASSARSTWPSACSASSRPAPPTCPSTLPTPPSAWLSCCATPSLPSSSPSPISPTELPVQNELLVLLDSEWDSLISLQPTHTPAVPSLPDSLAYVIYTSGSTGQPKGAMLSHRGVVNYLLWCTQAYAVSDGGGAPVHSSLSFDLTVTSLLAPLVVGRRVVLVPESQGVEGLAQSLLAGDTFSLVKLTPSHLRLLEQQLPADKVAAPHAIPSSSAARPSPPTCSPSGVLTLLSPAWSTSTAPPRPSSAAACTPSCPAKPSPAPSPSAAPSPIPASTSSTPTCSPSPSASPASSSSAEPRWPAATSAAPISPPSASSPTPSPPSPAPGSTAPATRRAGWPTAASSTWAGSTSR